MGSTAIAANGFRLLVPFGTLLCETGLDQSLSRELRGFAEVGYIGVRGLRSQPLSMGGERQSEKL